MKYQFVIPKELDERITRLMPIACFGSKSEFVRTAIREYVKILEENLAEELHQ